MKDAKFLGDATNYQQVFLNVLQNAVVYSPAESVVEVKFSISPMAEGIKHDDFEDGCTILLSVIVQDKGPGIKQEDQALLFKPFVCLDENKNLMLKKKSDSLGVRKILHYQYSLKKSTVSLLDK